MMSYYNTAADLGIHDCEESKMQIKLSEAFFSHYGGAGKRYQTSCCFIWICPIDMFHMDLSNDFASNEPVQ